MELIKFMEQFPTEEKCRAHFKALRMQQGIRCKQCKKTKHYWLNGKGQFQCVSCKFRTTLRSGTIMENSNLSFKIWYSAMYLMTSTKKGISASEMQRQLGLKRYEPVWALMHKIRFMMGKQDSRNNLLTNHDLKGESYTHCESNSQIQISKRAKCGSWHKKKDYMLEEGPTDSITKKNQGDQPSKHKWGFFKMKALDRIYTGKRFRMAERLASQNGQLAPDYSRSFIDLELHIDAQLINNLNPLNRKTQRKWIQIIVGNAKRTFVGVHHIMKKKYLQNYLDEFAFKLNRRNHFKKLFEMALIAAVFYLR